MFLQKINPGEVVEKCIDIEINNNYLKREKKIIEKEIHQNKENPEEKFFYKIWKTTEYEKTPLGNFNNIKYINVSDINRFIERVKKKPFYFFL